MPQTNQVAQNIKRTPDPNQPRRHQPLGDLSRRRPIQKKEMNNPTFIKIADIIINLDHVTSVTLNFLDTDGITCLAITYIGGEYTEFFYDEEAEFITKFMLAGNRTYNLNNLYGDRNS
ncbi:hypothetical protein [Argonema antarcticum]|uniref:hypothetical protein n=1 Tax=Argonema antarcticum TaxID=2942763 RepID=UPI0020117280|nr:hypothetical protein [Argonema antarcticum]MCL1474413.1 hypothetical protein [Argonema antarcticum A004/B2]